MSKICDKCGKSFPVKIKIDNKVRNLCNRKFCLECSPFGCHNTSVEPPQKSKINKICGDVYVGFCKTHGDTKFIVEKNGHHRCKKCRVDAVVNSRRKKKQKLVDLFGGSCQECGYNKCQQALQFHHLDPMKKSFGISDEGTRKWSEMVKEAKKCILLCANCHFEIHSF
jgi:hypothetical protein